MKRSWAGDRANLTKALTDLGKHAKGSGSESAGDEHASLLGNGGQKKRSPLWLFIFPEGTITSDEERVKSKKYAEREGIVSLFIVLGAVQERDRHRAKREVK